MKITEYNNYTYFTNVPPSIQEQIKELVTFKPVGYYYTNAYKTGKWDGKISLYSYNKVPTGLLPRILKFLDENEIEYNHTIVLPAKKLTFFEGYNDIKINGNKLRDYQIESIKKIIENNRGIINLPVNAGKTYIPISIMKMEKDKKFVYLVHKKTLFTQIYNDIKNNINENIGIINSEKKEIDKRITIAMYKSLSNIIQYTEVKEWWQNEIDGFFIDECHHIPAKIYYKLLMLSNAPIRIGLSGTPFNRSDKKNLYLIGAIGEELINIKQKDLIEKNISVPIEIYLIEIKGYDDWDLDYSTALEKFIVNDEKRNNLIKEITKNNKQTLVIVERIKHGENLNKIIPNSKFINGQMNINEINQIIENFKQNKFKVLISTNILDEGVNIKNIEQIIFAGIQKSYISLMQRIGRGVRKNKNKDKIEIYDFIDYRNKYLINHFKTRLKKYKRENFSIKMYKGSYNGKIQ